MSWARFIDQRESPAQLVGVSIPPQCMMLLVLRSERRTIAPLCERIGLFIIRYG